MMGSQLHQEQLMQSYKSMFTKQVAYIKDNIRKLCELKAYVSKAVVCCRAFIIFMFVSLKILPLGINMMFTTFVAIFSFRYWY